MRDGRDYSRSGNCASIRARTKILSPSFRTFGLPLAFQSRFPRNCNDGVLDSLRRVCQRSFVPYLSQTLSRIGGYFSSRLYASLGGSDRRKIAFLTATILPVYVFVGKQEMYLICDIQRYICHRFSFEPFPTHCWLFGGCSIWWVFWKQPV